MRATLRSLDQVEDWAEIRRLHRGELAALAEMLQAVARGWYPDLAPHLVARAKALTEVRPPVPVHSEVGA